jgi:hypothetical protein
VAYVESPLKAEISQQIAELPHDPNQREDRLCNIIKAHRLRMWFQSQIYVSLTTRFRYQQRSEPCLTSPWAPIYMLYL